MGELWTLHWEPNNTNQRLVLVSPNNVHEPLGCVDNVMLLIVNTILVVTKSEAASGCALTSMVVRLASLHIACNGDTTGGDKSNKGIQNVCLFQVSLTSWEEWPCLTIAHDTQENTQNVPKPVNPMQHGSFLLDCVWSMPPYLLVYSNYHPGYSCPAAGLRLPSTQ